MADHVHKNLEKHYTCWIERSWHIHNKSPFESLATGLLVCNALIINFNKIFSNISSDEIPPHSA